MKIDLHYLCTVIGNLSGFPIRLYSNGKLSFYHSVVQLPKDPVQLYLDQLFSMDEHVSYFVTPIFNYYGMVQSKTEKIIIGPTRQLDVSDQQLRELAFQCDVPAEDTDEFVLAMKNIVPMPLDSMIQILFAINHILNGETLSLQDIRIYEDAQESFIKKQKELEIEQKELAVDLGDSSNNSFALEQTLLNIVHHGDTGSLKRWLANAPAVKPGIIAQEQLRQTKNTFIVTATLVCRSAIRGGMDVHEAMSLSDAYIQNCELQSDLGGINNLQYRMVLDYTERVERIRRGKTPTQLTIDVTNYVLHHLSEPIKTEDIAKALFFSRSRLSTRFREETGVTLTDYILKEKSIEGKRLLRYTDKSVSAISEYLGFSSQSHFNRVFKKYIGITPKEYRSRRN